VPSTTLQIRDRILDYLRSEYPMPVTTKAVQTAIAATVREYPGAVYTQLNALAALGDVERVHRDDPRAAYWRHVPDHDTAGR